MKTNQGAIILAERAAEYGRLRSVLRQWGYSESEIQRFLEEPRADHRVEARRDATDDQSGKIAHMMS